MGTRKLRIRTFEVDFELSKCEFLNSLNRIWWASNGRLKEGDGSTKNFRCLVPYSPTSPPAHSTSETTFLGC